MAQVESPPKRYAHTAYGLHIVADISLPELPVSLVDELPDVEIRCRPLAGPPVDIPPDSGGIVWHKGDGTRFFWPTIGVFWVREGREIIVDIAPETDLLAVRVPLLGCVLGVLLHQRGLFTLHASAIVLGRLAVAFIGEKGAGKSTMAAALHTRGHSMLVDDVLALGCEGPAPIYALPGFPQWKLWPASVQALGQQIERLPLIHREIEKRAMPVEAGFQETEIPLGSIVVLAVGGSIALHRLTRREAFVQLLTHSYAARFIGESAAGSDHFQWCERVVDHVPVYRLERPRDLVQLSHVAQFIEKELSASV